MMILLSWIVRVLDAALLRRLSDAVLGEVEEAVRQLRWELEFQGLAARACARHLRELEDARQ